MSAHLDSGTQKAPWGVVGLLAIAFCVSWLDRMVINLLIEPIKADLHLSDIQIGLLSGTFFALFYALVGLVAGSLVDRGDRKWIICAGVLLWSLMTAAAGFARSFLHLVVARCGVAVGEASLSPATFALIADSFPRHQMGRAMSTYYLGGILGPGLALIIGAQLFELAAGPASQWPLLSQQLPWQRVLILAAIPGLVLAVVLSVLVKSCPPNVVVAGTGLPTVGLFEHIRARRFVYASLAIGIALIATFLNGVFTWGAVYCMRRFAMPIQTAGATIGTCFMIAGAAGCICGGLLRDWLVRQGYRDASLRAMQIVVAIGFPFAVAVPFASTVPGVLLCIGGGSFGVAASNVVGPVFLQALAPASLRGRLSAIYLAIVSIIGMGSGPVLVPVMARLVSDDQTDLGMGIAMSGVIAFGGGLACLMACRKSYMRAFTAEQQYAL